MTLRRIHIGELAADQPLPWPLYSQRGTLVLPAGSQVGGEEWAALLTLGLYIESSQFWHRPPLTPLQTVLHATHRVAQLLANPEKVDDFGAEIAAVAELIAASCWDNPAVVTATVVLYRGGPLAARHVVNTACIAAIVLQAMQASPATYRSVLAAALTMNIGMHELHERLASQAGPLSQLQQAMVVRHPHAGVERLRKLGIEDPLWLRAVQEHHEALDGSGYPQGLLGDQVAQAAQLVGLADLFCARVSERGYREADNARLVLRDVLIERGRYFGAMQAAYFIRALGVYPIGTLVLLANGEVGVVSSHGELVDAPWVHVLQGPSGQPYLQTLRRATGPIDSSIVDTLRPSTLAREIDLAAIWGPDAADYPLTIPTLQAALRA